MLRMMLRMMLHTATHRHKLPTLRRRCVFFVLEIVVIALTHDGHAALRLQAADTRISSAAVGDVGDVAAVPLRLREVTFWILVAFGDEYGRVVLVEIGDMMGICSAFFWAGNSISDPHRQDPSSATSPLATRRRRRDYRRNIRLLDARKLLSTLNG